MMPPQAGPAVAPPGGVPPTGPGVAAPGSLEASGAAAPQGPPPEMLRGIIQEAAQDPRTEQLIQSALQQVESGELTPQEVAQLGQMAFAALQDPRIYPSLVDFVTENGLVSGMPEMPDPTMLGGLLIAARQVSQMSEPQGGGAPGGAGPAVAGPSNVPSLRKGGPMPHRIKTHDGGMTARVHEGEYVVPAHVVRRKGIEFFDKLLEPPKAKTGA